MLFLFNKVYVKLDTNFTKSRDMVIMSNVTSSLPTDDFMKAVMEIDLGKVHLSGTSYEDVVAQLGGDDQFMSYLTEFDETKRLVIYADDQSFTTIMYKWYKALLPHATMDAAYKVIYCVFKRFEHIFGTPYNPCVKLSPQDNLRFRSFGATCPSYEQFIEEWNSTVPFDLSVKGHAYYAERCGLEFQLATYLSDPDTPLADILERKLVSMVRKIHVRYIIDLREIILSHSDMLPDYDIHEQTLNDWIASHPDYAFLTDPKFLPDNWKYIEDTYGFDTLNKIFLEMTSQIGYVVGSNLSDVLNPFTLTTLQDIIDLELSYVKWRMYISRWEYGLTTNTYLVEHMLEMKRIGNIEALRQLSV